MDVQNVTNKATKHENRKKIQKVKRTKTYNRHRRSMTLKDAGVIDAAVTGLLACEFRERERERGTFLFK